MTILLKLNTMKKLFLMAILMIVTISVNAQYKICDICMLGGVKGIVVAVDATGNHGLIMSLEESKADWIADKKLAMETNAFYEDDGMKNMKAIETYIKENGKSWNSFPLFAWARSLGDGWYIPSREELLTIWTNLNGGNLDLNKKSRPYWKAHNKAIKRSGGDQLFCSSFSTMGFKMICGMISSTESEGGKVYVINTERGQNLMNHPMGAPNVKIVEYTIGKKAHRSEGDILGFKRVLRFKARAVHRF